MNFVGNRAATPSLKSYGVGRGRQSRGVPGHRSPRQGTKHGNEHNFVTLEDVKGKSGDKSGLVSL